MNMRSIAARFVMLVATAAVAPLVIYGLVSVSTLRSGTRASVTTGNLNVAKRAAEQIQTYLTTNVRILQTAAVDLHNTYLAPWQQDRILKNYVLSFPVYRELTLFDPAGHPLATSRIAMPSLRVPDAKAVGEDGVHIAPVTVDDDLLPTTTVAVRVTGLTSGAGWLVGELHLEELWRMVDRIRVGERGVALLVGADGQLIAHGDPDGKPRVARGENLATHPLVRQVRGDRDQRPVSAEYLNERGEPTLAVAAAIQPLGWTVIVEQPTAEAYAAAQRATVQLGVVVSLALLVTITLGYVWSRSFIRPIHALMRGTRAISEGRLDEPVHITSRDEFRQLGDAFNNMAQRVSELQEDVRKQERLAMFGRIAVGLVHDLSHPIQNIGNNCKLIMKMFDDADYRATFRRMVDREFSTIKRVLDDLRNLARPMPLERFPIDINRSITEVVDAMREHAENAGLVLETRLSPEPVFVNGDVFALGRVYRNLIVNAIQATTPGGLITVSLIVQDAAVEVHIADTGCGIPSDRLGAIFEDFVTTKRRGLGLGLAISKKIVDQLEGTISVVSEVGSGTTFVLRFPRTHPRQVAAAEAG